MSQLTDVGIRDLSAGAAKTQALIPKTLSRPAPTGRNRGFSQYSIQRIDFNTKFFFVYIFFKTCGRICFYYKQNIHIYIYILQSNKTRHSANKTRHSASRVPISLQPHRSGPYASSVPLPTSSCYLGHRTLTFVYSTRNT